MPEFLERRYGVGSRTIFATLTVVSYAAVNLAMVLYSGGLALNYFSAFPCPCVCSCSLSSRVRLPSMEDCRPLCGPTCSSALCSVGGLLVFGSASPVSTAVGMPF